MAFGTSTGDTFYDYDTSETYVGYKEVKITATSDDDISLAPIYKKIDRDAPIPEPVADSFKEAVKRKVGVRTPSKPIIKNQSLELKSCLLNYVNENIVHIVGSYLFSFYSPLALHIGELLKDPANSPLQDLMDLNNNDRERYRLESIDAYSNPFLFADGLYRNAIFLDGVLEYFPSMMEKATFLKSISSFFYNSGKNGYLIIKHYTPEYLKDNAQALHLTPKDDGFITKKFNGADTFIRGITHNDVAILSSFSRLSQSKKMNLPTKETISYTIVA